MMELQYHGGTSVRAVAKKFEIISDSVSDVASIKPDLKKVSVALVSKNALRPAERDGLFIVDGPGEYEFENCSIKGIAAQSFQGADGDHSNTMYTLSTTDVKILFVGSIKEKLREDQLESIGMVDIVIVPVGGNGYSLDALGAATVVRAVGPKLVVPVFYAEDGVKYEVPPAQLEAFAKELGVVAEAPVEKYKIKLLPEQLTIQPITVS